MQLQRFNHLLHRTPPESLLLRPAPGIGLAAPTAERSGTQIFADVVKVAEKDPLLSEHLPALKLDPLGPISPGVDDAVQSPACLPRAVSPAPSGFFHATESGPVECRGAILGLGRH